MSEYKAPEGGDGPPRGRLKAAGPYSVVGGNMVNAADLTPEPPLGVDSFLTVAVSIAAGVLPIPPPFRACHPMRWKSRLPASA